MQLFFFFFLVVLGIEPRSLSPDNYLCLQFENTTYYTLLTYTAVVESHFYLCCLGVTGLVGFGEWCVYTNLGIIS
jgi:hypothetical protein